MLNQFDLFCAWLIIILSIVLFIVYGGYTAFTVTTKYARVENFGGSPFMSKKLMNMTYWILTPLENFFIFCKISPHAISFLSLGLGLVASFFISQGLFGLSALFATISFLFDAVDGMVARKLGKSSLVGAVIDSSLDRYVEFFFLSGIIFYYQPKPFIILLGLSTLLGSFMVSYSTAKAETLQIALPRGIMRRAERALYLTAGTVLTAVSLSYFQTDIPIISALLIVALFSNFSAVQRLYHIILAVSLRNDQ